MPWRNGADTDWMPEPQIESAYRERLQQRRRRERDLREIHDQAVTAVTSNNDASWIVAVARPEIPSTRSRPFSLNRAQALFNAIWAVSWRKSFEAPGTFPASYLLAPVPVKRGLRRYRVSGLIEQQGLGNVVGRIRATAEIHFDGTVVLATSRGGVFALNEMIYEWRLATTDLEQTCLDLLLLTQASFATFQLSTDFEVRFSVVPARTTFLSPDRIIPGKFRPPEEEMPPFLPVEAPLILNEGTATMFDSFVEVARDVVHQTGAETTLDAGQLEPNIFSND